MVVLSKTVVLLFFLAWIDVGYIEALQLPAGLPTLTSPSTALSGFHRVRQLTTRLSASAASKCTPLPAGMSPFQKSLAKGLDIQGTFRKIAATAIDRAIADGVDLMEIDFPPFSGNGDLTKSQFDDFDNVQELNANRDWCVQLAPMIQTKTTNPRTIITTTWLILPDDKECELAATEWTGQLFRKNTRFTSIRAACQAVFDASLSQSSGTTGTGIAVSNSGSNSSFQKAWGSRLAEAVNKLQGGDGILADSSTLDVLDTTPSSDQRRRRLHLVCQPGNGGPVEDWINVERLHQASAAAVPLPPPTCVVNGALDKVRDGYYPAFVFPALARTVPFYQQFQAILIVKPISDKGLYGWLYRVYPEPWQVILQTARAVLSKDGSTTSIQVDDCVALISDVRPTYAQAVSAMVKEAAKAKQ